MKRSRNELFAMAVKAARGSGLSIGLANDFAQAAVIHFCEGRDGKLLLDALSDGSATALPSIFDDVETAGAGHVTGKPALDVVRSYCEARGKVVGQEFEVTINEDHIALNLNTAKPKQDGPIKRPDVPTETWDALSKLASKTYVPATEASRLSGAGAGLSDND